MSGLVGYGSSDEEDASGNTVVKSAEVSPRFHTNLPH